MSNAALRQELQGTAAALTQGTAPAPSPRETARAVRHNAVDLEAQAAEYGWIDPPPSCVHCCGPLLTCCRRHPKQKRSFIAENARAERDKRLRGVRDTASTMGLVRCLQFCCCLRLGGRRSSAVPAASVSHEGSNFQERVADVSALYAEVESGGTEHAALRCGPRHAVSVRAILVHTSLLAWLAFVFVYIILWGQYQDDAVAASLLRSWGINMAISVVLIEVREST